MEIIRAKSLGMCFGVLDAVEAARSLASPRATTALGELVHNPLVLEELDRRGLRRQAEGERDRIPSTPVVLVTAHGISDRQRTRLESAGKALVDTTCPLVRRVHSLLRRLAAEGCHVVVVGQPGHVEVRGLVGDLDRYSVIAEASQAVAIEDGSRRIAVVCQTTTPPAVAEAAFAAVRERNPGKEIRFHDTICQPTRERQEALAELLERVEALVVVGGRRSNNTRALAKLAESRGLPCVQVERAEELDPEWFRAFAGAAVGLSAGTSTLPETVDAVERALEGIAAAMGSPLSAAAAAGI